MSLSFTPRLSFSEKIPTLQLAWDSTSLGEFKLCKRRYYYNIIRGFTPLISKENVHLRFGGEYAAAHEHYNHMRSDGASHEEAIHGTVKFALISTWDTKLDRPWISDDPNKNRETLIRSLIDYFDKYGENDPIQTVILANGEAAVELSFRVELDRGSETTGEPFLLCGHFDKLGIFLDYIWVVDQKTTKYTLNDGYFAQYSPHNQVSTYSYAGKVVAPEPVRGVIIDAAQILVNTTDFARREIHRSETQLDEWRKSLDLTLTEAEYCAVNDDYPQNDMACGGVYEDPITGDIRYGCPFRPVCGARPEIRETLLKLHYTTRDPMWDPLRPRGRKSTRPQPAKELTNAA